MKKFTTYIACLVIILLCGSVLCADWELEFETGPVFSGYNNIRIPKATGTNISLKDDLETKSKIAFRLRLTYNINDKHTLSALFAPLELSADGQVGKIIFFEGVEFPANTPLDATYRFDSYRITYRYNFYRKPKLKMGVGFTAKIRDAEVSVWSSESTSIKTNTGFVPLINFNLQYAFSPEVSFILRGDALAAPQGQGRAEDIMAVVQYSPFENTAFRFGYRILEGGADVDEVYNFTLLHYIVLGVVISSN